MTKDASTLPKDTASLSKTLAQSALILFSIKTATFNPPSASDAFNKIVRQAADCIAKSIDNMVESLEHLVFESHGAKLLPNLLYGIHFRRVWRYVQQSDVVGNLEPLRFVPTCPITNQQNLVFRIGL